LILVVSNKLGRNDPCHCGSGKKYKKCHLAEDERRESRLVVEQPAGGEAESFGVPSFDPSGDPLEALRNLRKLQSKLPRKLRETLERSLAPTLPVFEYLDHEAEIKEAGRILEAHRAEYIQFHGDREAYMKRAHDLFAEDRFASLRFSATEVAEAMKKAGLEGGLRGKSDESVADLIAAINGVATKERRRQLSVALLMRLPEIVRAKRFLDGWILQECALMTVEEPGESNAFLYEMFSYGYDAWMKQLHAEEMSFIHLLGLDPDQLHGMNLEEIQSVLRKAEEDPIMRERMDALVNSNPELRKRAEDEFSRLEREAAELLEREDARHLLLPLEEVEPFMDALYERWREVQARFPKLSKGGKPSAKAKEAINDTILTTTREMSGAVFTPERIEHLIPRVAELQAKFFDSGDREGAQRLFAAISQLKRETEPENNRYLLSICFLSIRRYLDQVRDGTPGNAEAESAGQPGA
jgi:hypothetical protein